MPFNGRLAAQRCRAAASVPSPASRRARRRLAAHERYRQRPCRLNRRVPASGVRCGIPFSPRTIRLRPGCTPRCCLPLFHVRGIASLTGPGLRLLVASSPFRVPRSASISSELDPSGATRAHCGPVVGSRCGRPGCHESSLLEIRLPEHHHQRRPALGPIRTRHVAFVPGTNPETRPRDGPPAPHTVRSHPTHCSRCR